MRPSCGTRFSAMLRFDENLDARHDGRLEPLDLRGHRHFLQQAVDAVADAQFVLERLDVNVRRAQRERVAEDLIDEADDARVFGGLVEVAVVLAVVRDDLEAFLLFEQVERVRADAEVLLYLALERRAGREHGLELEVGERLEAIQPRRGEQAAERYFDVPVFLAQRQHLLPQEDARREAR